MGPEEFWEKEFGKAYHDRQKENDVGSVVSNTAFFAKVLSKTHGVKKVVEFGAGAGQNISALNNLGITDTVAIEINEVAASMIPSGEIFRGSLFDYNPEWGVGDLSFTKGVLIHVPPEDLHKAYDILYRSSTKYILVAEYYNPTPVNVEYRGNSGKLWKRDFAGEMLEAYPDLKMVDYGFVSRRDQFPQDDISWFLMEKVG